MNPAGKIIRLPLKIPVFGDFLRWLQKDQPTGNSDNVPILDENGQTSIPGVWLAGDLRGIPLLKMAFSSGIGLVKHLHSSSLLPQTDDLPDGSREKPYPLLIVGFGAAGLAAAHTAQKLGIKFQVLESAHPMTTIQSFPKGKPIYLEPESQTWPEGLRLNGTTKEELLPEMRELAQGIPWQSFHLERLRKDGPLLRLGSKDSQTLFAHQVILAMGRGGAARRLQVPGEEQDHILHRLIDPADFKGQKLAIIGGGDSAAEAAIACSQTEVQVTLIHRGEDFPRLKPQNHQKLLREEELGHLAILRKEEVRKFAPDHLLLKSDRTLECSSALILIGQDPPHSLLRKLGIRLSQDWEKTRILAMLASVIFCYFLYRWKKGQIFASLQEFSFPGQPDWLFLNPSAIYGLIYTLIVVIFGVFRIRRRPTPYIKWQTLTLALIQVFPLFLLPVILLPLADASEVLPTWFKTHILLLDEAAIVTAENSWRIYGLILAWPLFPFNWLTENPSVFWLGFGFVQTFILIPLAVLKWGKGAYCGWICSCGALAETMGDSQRTKTPHGPTWKRLENWGQIAFLILVILTLIHWIQWIPGLEFSGLQTVEYGLYSFYGHVVDFWLASVLGIGLYWFLGGRFWCRFFCPLAAFMHIIGRFSRFRIFAKKERCISCGVCTRVCHQGIDVMAYASRGRPMDDVQCVSCSSCVVECPTDVLSFGELKGSSHTTIAGTRLP